MSAPIPREALADAPADASTSPPDVRVRGFRTFAHYQVTLRHHDGTVASLARDILHVGKVVGVLAIDPARNMVVLIRQFRLAAHLAVDLGEQIEIVAGHVERGEAPQEAARRECVEEIGVEPRALHLLFNFLPAPGINDEYTAMFLAIVDSTQVPERAGAAHESEDTQPLCVDIDVALAALADGHLHNGYLILALQWLALNRHRVGAIAGAEPDHDRSGA
jgi:ADP-ribose pyrophosphatase